MRSKSLTFLCVFAALLTAALHGGCAPQMAMTARERGDPMRDDGHFDSAIGYYNKALEQNPSDGLAYFGRAQARSQRAMF